MRWGKPRVDAETVAVARRRLAVLSAQLGAHVEGDTGQPERAPQASPTTGGRHVADSDDQESPLVERVSSQLAGRTFGMGVTSAHLLVVAIVVALCVAVGAWMFVRARPVPVSPRVGLSAPASVTSPLSSTPGALPAMTPGLPTSAPMPTPSVLVVDVAGKVRRPGIVELPPGARVVDALDAAGGARSGVRLTGLNLARPLVDGEQVLVGVRPAAMPTPAPGGAGPSPLLGAPAGLVHLNTATQEQLESLPGIGPVTALAILTWREENGAFTSVDELLEVSGIGDATLAELRAFVTV